MRIWLQMALISGTIAPSTSAIAQVPQNLAVCMSIDPVGCAEVRGRDVFDPSCQRRYQNFYGRVAWYPLLCVGPITVEVEARQTPDTRYPLYVEVVPLGGSQPCDSGIGSVVLVANGSVECGGWETSGLIDITRTVPLGAYYAIRLHFFGHPAGFSPAVDCVRVTAAPVVSGTTVVNWGKVKGLYRDATR